MHPAPFSRHHRRTPAADSRAFASLLLASALAAGTSPIWAAAPTALATPILRPPAQDPQIVYVGGKYVYCESSDAGIFVRVSHDFRTVGEAPQVKVWTPPRRGPMAKNVWAPELHVLNGRCYIYFAADDGDNANHRMWVLVSRTSDPMSGYELVGSLDTAGWAIDGTVLSGNQGELYFVWSGWPGHRDGQQNLYISRMDGPTRLAGARVLLTTPDQPWERRGMPICEGPQILRRGGKTFIVYSASASWTADYCLGMLVNEGGDPMDPASWRKTGQVFGRNQYAWGLGHCGFLTTAEGEDWIFYHAKTSLRNGWLDREVRAQPFGWTDADWPELGEPGAVVDESAMVAVR